MLVFKGCPVYDPIPLVMGQDSTAIIRNIKTMKCVLFRMT
jgi:hypothetical protein